MIERHHAYVMRSNGIAGITTIKFNPLDTPTSLEQSTINLNNSTAAVNYTTGSGALDGFDVRNRLIKDESSGYAGIEPMARPIDPPAPVAPQLGEASNAAS